MGSHPARRRAELSDHRVFDAAHRNRRTDQEGETRHRHSRAADAQSGDPCQAARVHGPFVGWPAADGHGVGMVPARVQRHRRAVRAARQDHGREPRHPEAVLDRTHRQRQVSSPRHPRRRHVPQAGAEAASADLDRRICRPRSQTGGDSGRWLAHLLLPAGKFRKVLGQDSRFRRRKAARTRTSFSTLRSYRS